MSLAPRPAAERFWALVNGPWIDPNIGPADCWRWCGATAGSRPPRGAGPLRRGKKPWKRYGRFWLEPGRLVNAHRMALELTVGPPADPDAVASHTVCDQPLCCNPAHLTWASQAANVREAMAKQRLGRNAAGRFASLGAVVV